MQHVVVVGAGIIGAAAAFALSQTGARVTVIDGAQAGGGATGASFGWINASFHQNDHHFRLRRAAMAAHRRLDALVPGHVSWGGCYWNEAQGDAQLAFAARLSGLGYPVESLDAVEVGRRLPALARPEPMLWFPEEGVVDPDRYAQALLRAAGAELWAGMRVDRLLETGGRVTGVETSAGRIVADAVVVASGTGSPDLMQSVGLTLPMLNRPGLLVRTSPVAPITTAVLCGLAGEIRQRADGRLILPTAIGHQGDTTEKIVELPGDLAREAVERTSRMFNGVALKVEQVALGHRPVPKDGLPVLDMPLPGLAVAVMHSGVTLAALAGGAIADLISKGATDPLWHPYRLGRFAGVT